jgi:acyl phosphate:glycerol-3-phosphate acyltransferase
MILSFITIIIFAYLIGSIPFGLIIVKILKGHDLRTIESGRTGGTNAGRAAGFGAGALTGILDFLKGVVAVALVKTMLPDTNIRPWIEAVAGVLAILGHNYPIFLLEKVSHGKYRLRGGAGGAPCLGASTAISPPAVIIILPLILILLLGVGYASITTLAIAFIALIIFIHNAIFSGSSWAYVVYAVIAQVLLIIALKPNIQRLLAGNERSVGIRPYLKKKKAERKTG